MGSPGEAVMCARPAVSAVANFLVVVTTSARDSLSRSNSNDPLSLGREGSAKRTRFRICRSNVDNLSCDV